MVLQAHLGVQVKRYEDQELNGLFQIRTDGQKKAHIVIDSLYWYCYLMKVYLLKK